MTPDDLDLIRATIARGKPISTARAKALVEAYEQVCERERIVAETYNQQQSSYRELEALYQAMTERAMSAEADAAALYDMLNRQPGFYDGLATKLDAAGYPMTSGAVKERAQSIRRFLEQPHPGIAVLGERDAVIKDLTAARDTVAGLWLDLEELKAELAAANAIIAGLRRIFGARSATAPIDNDHAKVGWGE